MSTYWNPETGRYENFEMTVIKKIKNVADKLEEVAEDQIEVVAGIRYDTDEQGLTDAQQENARTNIDAVSSTELTEALAEQKAEIDAEIDEVGDDVADLRGAIGTLPTEKTYTPITLTRYPGSLNENHLEVGQPVSIYTTENLSYFIINVYMAKSAYIYYRIQGTSEYPYWAFTDENDIVISIGIDSGTDGQHKEQTLTVPQNASKLYFWTYGNENNYNTNAKCSVLYYVPVTTFINSFHETLPNYYYTNNWLQNKIDAIKSATNIKNGIVFGFATDFHFEANDKNSKLLIKKVLDNTSVNFVIAGGDYPANNGTIDDLKDSGKILLDYIRYCNNKILPIHGNHDFSITTSDGQRSIDIGYAIDYITRPIEENVNGVAGKMYWYKDINNTRIIALDGWENYPSATNPNNTVQAWITQEQYDWFINLLNTANNKQIIVVTHSAINSTMDGYVGTHAPIHAIIKAYIERTTYTYQRTGTLLDGQTYEINIDADFSDATGTFVFALSGHSHLDEATTEDGILNISTTCDAHYTADGEGAVSNTTTEQAIDIYCINYETNIIEIIRVGRGENRNYEF